ncbi:uncharacterized protein G2W53_033524 [Senna tora]|uniref:Transposase MuDR plant domain-containing protein n=1 Tax=Senna tora TaxID=362788 RepID=A0A834SZB8_9FABA|nr:uncharacterized protein G2W53_033524 [Senna tora]
MDPYSDSKKILRQGLRIVIPDSMVALQRQYWRNCLIGVLYDDDKHVPAHRIAVGITNCVLGFFKLSVGQIFNPGIKMHRKIFAYIYYDGEIKNGIEGIIFACRRPKGISLEENITLGGLKTLINEKLNLSENQTVSEIIYRMPLNMNPLRYGQFHVGEDSDFQFVIQRHLQICSEFGLMEFYVEISTHDINMDIENQFSFDYNTQPTPQTDQTLIPSSSRLQIVGTCQPPTEDLGEFSDEDEYEASVPIWMSHQDKENDNVGEDVVEEELANFYSQVDVERARGFIGDFGPRSEDVGELYEGMKFPTKAALRRHVKLYHIKNNCTFVVAKSGSNFENWRCPKFGKECAWRLRATQKVNTYHWEITICPEKHIVTRSSKVGF